MFEYGFPTYWTTLKKLIWLYGTKLKNKIKELVVKGIAPLTLLNAIANKIISLTQYGKCEQKPVDYLATITQSGACEQKSLNYLTMITQSGVCEQNGTPTPTLPVDIVCNNGVLKYSALGTNLFDPCPSAILLNYYRNTSTGIVTASNPNFMSAGYIPIKPDTSYVFFGRKKSDNTISSWNRIYWFDANKDFISTCAYTKDTVTVATSPANAVFAQIGVNYNNSTTNVITQAEVDAYNYTFCEGTAEPETFVPFVGGVRVVGTPETVFVFGGKNLFDKKTATMDKLIDATTGELSNTSAGSGRFASAFIPIKPNTTYSCNAIDDTSAQNGVAFYDINKAFVSGIPYSSAMKTSKQFTVPNTASICYCRFCCYGYTSINEAMLVEGETLGDYEAYKGKTASVVNLFGIGDNADTQEIIGGAVTHNIGVLVLNGTENWQMGTSTFLLDDAISRAVFTSTAMCTHFTTVQNDTAPNSIPNNGMKVGASGYRQRIYIKCTSCADNTAFKALLAEQYAAGTPVIVLYPLETATTESVVLQSLQTTDTVTVDAVANVSGVTVTTTRTDVSTPTPNTPLPVWCNNGELKPSPNLLDPSIITSGTSNGITIFEASDGTITATGSLDSGTYAQFTYTMTRTLPAGTYTISLNNSTALASGALVGFGINGNVSVGSRGCGLTATNSTKTFTIDEGDVANRLVIRLNGDLTGFSMKIQVERGDRATTYRQFGTVYTDGTPETLTISSVDHTQTVNDISNLLAVSDYADTEEIIAGIRTGKLGVMILDGTENFYVSTGDTYGVGIDKNKYPGSYVDAVPVLCTHLPFSTSSSTSQTNVICNRSGNYGIRFLFNENIMALAETKVAAAKAFISAEYAKGTPIMVVYIKTTQTTEQTVPHPMGFRAGTYTISVDTEVTVPSVVTTNALISVPDPVHSLPIWCNNGKLVVGDMGLPEGYKRLLGITFDGDTYYETTYYLRGADTLRFSFLATVAGRNVIGSYVSSDSSDNFTLYFAAISVGSYLRYDGTLYRPRTDLDTRYNCVISPTGVTGLRTDITWEPAVFTSSAPMFIGWLDNATSAKFVGDMYGSIVVDNRAEFIPVERENDGAIGYWDGTTFLENQGTGTPVSLGYDYSKLGVKAVGTPETLMVSGKNLLNTATNVTGKYINTSGFPQNAEDAQYTALIPVTVGETYMVSLVSGRNSGKDRLHGYDANGQWVKQIVFVDAEGEQEQKLTMTAIIDSGISFVRLSYGITDTDAMIEESSIATAYQPYVAPQTINDVSNLFAVGDYKDTEELVEGIRIGRVGAKALDGTESWSYGVDVAYMFVINEILTPANMDDRSILSTHFKTQSTMPSSSAESRNGFVEASAGGKICIGYTAANNDVAAFKAFLAAEYAAGHPVIIVYPVATEITEQTTAHDLNLVKGTNVISITAEVPDIELEVKYKGK